jgi:hypothetical protein
MNGLGRFSPLWATEHVLIRPRPGRGSPILENIIEILPDNLGPLRSGETQLRNQIV